MDSLKLFGKRIKELRKAKKLTQERLGELVGVDYKHIGNIEGGKYFTTMQTLEKIANALECEISELFNFSHNHEKEVILDSIRSFLDEAPDDKIRILYRIIKDVLK